MRIWVRSPHSARKITRNAVTATRRCEATSFSTSSSSWRSFTASRRASTPPIANMTATMIAERPVRQKMEERQADRHGDHDMHRKPSGRPQPDQQWPPAGRQHEGGEHGLVRELAQEDDGEDGEDDVELQGGPFCRATERSAPGTFPSIGASVRSASLPRTPPPAGRSNGLDGERCTIDLTEEQSGELQSRLEKALSELGDEIADNRRCRGAGIVCATGVRSSSPILHEIDNSPGRSKAH